MKRIIGIMLVAVMAFVFTACTDTSGLEKRIDDLSDMLTQQTDKLGQQTEKITDLENENKALEDKLAQLENELEIAKTYNVFVEKIEESFWDGLVKISASFPRILRQGEEFSITITTTSIADKYFRYKTCSTWENVGVRVGNIRLASNYETTLDNYDNSTDDTIWSTFWPGEVREYATKWFTTAETYSDLLEKYVRGDAPRGAYDIYLSNGEVYRNAFVVI